MDLKKGPNLHAQEELGPPPKAPRRLHRLVPVLAVFLTLLWTRPWSHKDLLSQIPSCPGRPDVQCGMIEVPKDYTGQSIGFTLIAFARMPALKLPSKGTIFVNPGGPGGPGKTFVLERGDAIRTFLGDQWDIVGFDPRGIGDTVPAVKCYSDPLEEKLFKANTVLERGFTIPSNFSALHRDSSSLEAQYNEFLSLKEIQAKKCSDAMGEELMFTGTSDVVRDIREMKQWFDPMGKINYWGGSYGSILGAYLVNMLPDEVGLVAIDGIADPVAWAGEPSHRWPKQWVDSAEDTYEIFLNQCVEAGPDHCPLARYGDSAQTLKDVLDKWFDDLITVPMLVPSGNRPGVLTSGQARASVFTFLHRPKQWPEHAKSIASALDGNATDLYNYMVRLPSPSALTDSAESQRLAVTCMDSPTSEYPTGKDLAEEGLKALKVSRFGMSTTVQEPDGGCQFWGYKPKARFEGPWNATLRTPMLIVTNTADPITPMQSALRINTLMPESSTLLVYDSPGHCSLSTTHYRTPPCVAKHVQAYFNGVVPANGTFCPSPGNMFTWQDSTREVVDRIMTEEDVKLAEAAMIMWDGH